VQSVAQLHDTYGKDRANALLSGLVQSVIMRVGDAASVEYAQSQIGREKQRRSVPVHDRNGRSVGRQELRMQPIRLSKATSNASTTARRSSSSPMAGFAA